MTARWEHSIIGKAWNRYGTKSVCCAILLFIVLVILSACAVDQAAVERKRQDLKFLCADPGTIVLKELCDRVTPGAAGPLDLTPPQ